MPRLIVPVLRSLQHVYSKPDVTEKIMKLIGQDINGQSSAKLGREGMDYWHISVLASVRLGCNYTYDQVQDLSENHFKLRAIMGLGWWDEHTEFTWQTIRDNICRLKPETIDQISRLIVAEGQTREAIVTRDRSHRRRDRTEQRQIVQRLSFDRGFHSPDNHNELAEIIPNLCLPKPGAKQSKVQLANADEEFLAAQQNHPGVESAIGALQSGNAMKRCRDRSEIGFERYVSLAILGRNLHTLGRMLIAAQAPDSGAATRRKAA